MMSEQDTAAEHLAKLFHYYQEALSQDFGCEPKEVSFSWEETPVNDRKRMIAAARLALLDLAAANHAQKARSEYFAKPGEAEWGC